MKLMKTMRSWFERNEKKFLVGLVIFLLVIFTVASEFVRWLTPDKESRPRGSDVVGSFALLPLRRTNVTRDQFETARSEWRLIARLSGASGDRIREADIWVYLLLRDAAKAQGVTVSDAEVRDELKRSLPDYIYGDVNQYKNWIRMTFGRTPRQFEEAVRSKMVLQRVHAIYNESFTVAPAATREEMVKSYQSQNIEYARIDYAALDAAMFLAQAEQELAAEKDADAKLKEFFEKDPTVQAERTRFQNPRRYRVEFLYTLHELVTTDEEYQRIEDLFHRAYPDYDVSKLEPNVKDMRSYFSQYKDRLLAQEGTTWKKVQEEVGKAEQPKENGDETKDGNKDEAKDENKEPDEATKEAWFERGFEICKEQILRELKVRRIYELILQDAAQDEKKSLKVTFDKLKAVDDPKNPVCSTSMGKGLIVYLEFDHPLSGEEIEDLEDRGVRFTHNVRYRVNKVGDTDLPKYYKPVHTLGDEGNGRIIIRVLEVLPQSRKTYPELEPREKEELRTEFYLPAQAREKAVEQLKALRKQCLDGDVEPSGFRAEAEKIGCRVFENEWITASYDFLAEPEKQILWPDAYDHMRDRHFLRQRLAGVLSRDRIKQELKPGSYLEVEADARTDAEDPGAAYLVVLLERRKPGVDTMPPTEYARALASARTRRISEDNERWSMPTVEKMDELFSDFEFEFYLDFKKRMDEERQRRVEAERKTPGQ